MTQALSRMAPLQSRVKPFESLVPYFSSRVVTAGQTPEGGSFALFDNDLYVHPIRLPKQSFLLEVIGLQFYLFFNPDGSHATPPIDVLGALLTPHLGYHFTAYGGVLGRSSDRA